MNTKEPTPQVILKVSKLTNQLEINKKYLQLLKTTQKLLTEKFVKDDEKLKIKIKEEIKMKSTDLFE